MLFTEPERYSGYHSLASVATTVAEREVMLVIAVYDLPKRIEYERASSRPWLPVPADPPLAE